MLDHLATFIFKISVSIPVNSQCVCWTTVKSHSCQQGPIRICLPPFEEFNSWQAFYPQICPSPSLDDPTSHSLQASTPSKDGLSNTPSRMLSPQRVCFMCWKIFNRKLASLPLILASLSRDIDFRNSIHNFPIFYQLRLSHLVPDLVLCKS